MPQVEASRTEKEGQKVRHGFIVDLSSEIKFDPTKFDAEIKKIDPPVMLPNERYQAKYVVIGDKMILFSVNENHIEGIEWIKKVFPDVDLNGEIKSAGHVTVNIRQAWMSVNKEVKGIISGMSTGLLQNGTLPLDKSEGYKQTILKEKLGDHFSITR